MRRVSECHWIIVIIEWIIKSIFSPCSSVYSKTSDENSKGIPAQAWRQGGFGHLIIIQSSTLLCAKVTKRPRQCPLLLCIMTTGGRRETKYHQIIFFSSVQETSNETISDFLIRWWNSRRNWPCGLNEDEVDESNDKNLPLKTRILTLTIGLHVRWDDSWQPVGGEED